MANVLLPTATGFSLPQTALDRIPQIIHKQAFAHDAAFVGGLDDGPFELDAASFFEFAGVDLDPETFLVEEIDVLDSVAKKNPSESVYSAKASIQKSHGNNAFSIKVYWSIPKVWAEEEKNDENGNLKQILQAFEGIVSSCWIEQYESDGRKIRRLVRTPEELVIVIKALALNEREKPEATTAPTMNPVLPLEGLLLSDNRGESQINQVAIDESSLKSQIVLDSNGFDFEIFSANRKRTTKIEKVPATTATNQTIWWRTLNMDHDKNPYGDLSQVWTDAQFRALLRGNRDAFFLRNLAVRLKQLAILIRRNASLIPWAFRRQDPESPIRKTQQRFPNHLSNIAQGLVSIAGIILFLGAGPFRMSSVKKIPKDIILEGMAKNRPYFRSMAIWLPCVLALDTVCKPILQQKLPLGNKSSIVGHLTTLSIAMQSIGIFVHAVQGYIDFLLKVPILVSLKLLSAMTTWWQRKRDIGKPAIFHGAIEWLVSWKVDESRPFWMDAVFFAPVREELIFRFAFDRVWYGFLGVLGVKAAVSRNSSVQPAWIWANSLLFGLVHGCNWLPRSTSSTPVSANLGDGDIDVWENILGALFQSTGTFLTAFFVFNPLYVRHGLSSSICAHAILNSIFVGLPVLVSRMRKRC